MTDDSDSEPTETVTLTLDDGGNVYRVGTQNSDTLNIYDNDDPVVSVTAMDTFEGAATGGFTFTRIGDLSSSLVVDYTVSGTADDGTDYEPLSGTVTFAAGEDRVEVPVEAFGDNIADDGETVIVTIDDGCEDYEIDDEADEATVTIADQPLMVSVVAVNDGKDGSTPVNGKFLFIRSGDLSEELTVYYTVSGTATSGTDFTALSGSVTFAEDEDEVFVDVYVLNDSTAEPTETVTLTLDEIQGYEFGIDSTTIFIKDIDSRRVYWTGAVSTEWDDADNWIIFLPENAVAHEVPGETDEVYFDGATIEVYQDCLNLGEGEESLTFKGIYLVGGYAGTVALAVTLSVEDYEQTSGTIDQPNEDYELTVTKTMLWSGGTINSTAVLSTVTISGSGATARFSPTDGGTVYCGSTVTATNEGQIEFNTGEYDFTNEAKIIIDEHSRVDVVKRYRISANNVTFEGVKQIEIKKGAYLDVSGESSNEYSFSSGWNANAPIINHGGHFRLGKYGVLVKLSGRVNYGGTTFDASYVQIPVGSAPNSLTLVPGSNLQAEFGVVILGGEVKVKCSEREGFGCQVTGDLTIEGGSVYVNLGTFRVTGSVAMKGGVYHPVIDGTESGRCASWEVGKDFSLRNGVAELRPDLVNTPVVANGKWEVVRLVPVFGKLTGGWRTPELSLLYDAGPPPKSFTLGYSSESSVLSQKSLT